MEIYFSKKLVVRSIILIALIGYFGSSLILGNKSFLSYFALKREIENEKNKVIRTKNKIKKLQTKITLWKQDDFELEKMAREKLQMGFSDEKVYLLK